MKKLQPDRLSYLTAFSFSFRFIFDVYLGVQFENINKKNPLTKFKQYGSSE